MMLACLLAGAYTLNDIIIAYETGEYRNAIEIGEDILDKAGDESDKRDAINLQTYIAFSYVAIGDTANAQKYFENILTLDITYTINEEFVSPKIIDVFNNAKNRINFLIRENPEYFSVKTGTQNIRFPRSNLIMKSAFVPGWGQIDEGNRVKGITVSSLFYAGIAGTAATLAGLIDARNKYYAASAEDAPQLYANYNNWTKANRIFTDISVAAYVFNILDIIWDE